MKFVLSFLGIIVLSNVLSAQIGINTLDPDKSSALDIYSSNKGVLIPRVSLTGINDTTTVKNPAQSLLVYNLSNGNNGTTNDTSDDVRANELYYFYDGKWNQIVNQSDLDNSITKVSLNKLITLANMKSSGNDNSFVSSDLGNNIRRFIFDNKVSDNLNAYNSTTGEFTAPYTGFYMFNINTLLKPWRRSGDNTVRVLALGLAKSYTSTFPTSGLTNANFYTQKEFIDPATGPNFITYMSMKNIIYMTAGSKTVALVKNVTPGSTVDTYQYNLNVEINSYNRVLANSMSIIFLGTD